jgi:hypothetical protein
MGYFLIQVQWENWTSCEGHITDPRNTRMEETSRPEKNGGVLLGMPGSRRDCSAIDGMELSTTKDLRPTSYSFL